ncbi:recombinase family protein [uncultured Sulfitobacter sp.]|uniref:recombinase family protein n=1 Tax=uncultured Sulfitobacter sp. TaxID=191468 RepID=UPI0030F68AB9
MNTHNMPDQQHTTAYSYVRFSSEGQKDGNSVERQTKRAQEWCQREGYNLSTETFEDLGVSAFKGANADVGALGAFLEAVEKGTINKGSILVVENLDRLSRQHFEEGYLLIKRITQTGINVVTLSDNKMYRAGSQLELVDMITMIVGFERANQESKFKSERVGAAWKSNAAKVADGRRKRTTKVPAWIEFNGDSLENGTFTVIEDKAALIRELFERYANGEPTSGMATDLRNRGIPTLSGKGKWTGPLVYMLVREVTPYGTLQIGKGTKKERVIIDTVADYYPRIVDEEIARRVRHRIQTGAAPLKVKQQGQCRGRLVGVLKSDEGNKAKAKKNNRSVSYVDYVTNKYIGAVSYIDQVLMDEWPEIVRAFGVETSAEAEGLEGELMAAQDNLEYLLARVGKRPNAALDRLVLAAEAEVEECLRNLQSVSRATRVYGSVPSEIVLLSIPEANQWVRKLIDEAKVYRDGKGASQRISIWLRLKNGVRLSIGDASVGLTLRN